MMGCCAKEGIEGSQSQIKQPVLYFSNHSSFAEGRYISRIAEMFAMSLRALAGQWEQELKKKVPSQFQECSLMLGSWAGNVWPVCCLNPAFCHTGKERQMHLAMHLISAWDPQQKLQHRKITESFRLENTSKITKCKLTLPRPSLNNAPSTGLLSISKDSASTTALGSLFKCLTTFSMKNFFPIPSLNLIM